MKNTTERFVFGSIPTNEAELGKLPESVMDTPYKTAALVMAVLCNYEKDPEATIAMLNVLKGPEEVSNYEKQFLKDRLDGKTYKPFSFFEGATPSNNYTPNVPYAISISSNPYSFDNENWAVMYVQSSGADSPRQIKLRCKPSTGQWFLNEIQCLSDIRVPVSDDPWA
ncbi:MAG: hypothetical protein IJ058_07790 [Lachnospiraceae bacterium]|nr:hypothetical protein [Lachnospiraceae bacterium]